MPHDTDSVPLPCDNLGHGVYQQLSDALLQGRLLPGHRLRIRELAATLGTSVTPVRDAILRLVQEQALVMRSPRDIRVPHMSLAQYLEIRAIRVRLEGLAAETAASRARTEDVARLQALVDAQEAAFAAGDTALGCALNQQFHFALVSLAGLPCLQGILQRLWLQMGPQIAAAYAAGGRDMLDFHQPILAALARGDGPAAAEAMARDLTDGARAIYQHLATPAG